MAKKSRVHNSIGPRVNKAIGVIFLLYAVGLALAYLGLVENRLFLSLDIMQTYVLGKVRFLLPLGLGLWGWQMLTKGGYEFFSKTSVFFILVMLCLSGTAHQFFTPVGKELYPQYIVQGGGVVGGALLLLAHRLVGSTWTLVFLAALWVLALIVVVPWGLLLQGWQNASRGLHSLEQLQQARKARRQEAEEQARQEAAATALKQQRTMGICSVYHQQEFSNFTEGLGKEKPMHRLLSFVSPGA